MIPLKLNSLMDFLHLQRFDVKLQAESQQLYTILSIDKQEFPLFIKVDSTGTILQLLLFMPCTMSQKAPPEVARLLHLLNKEIDLPGFGMDETAKVIFFRSVLPTSNGSIDKILLNNILTALPRIARVFFPVISATATGAYFEAIAGQVRESLKKFTTR